jgi:hypothetical protein
MILEPDYRSVVDVPGAVGQFLLNTGLDDLIIELIQNELDDRSPRTRIHVLDDRLVCEGEGQPIKGDGWKRLKFILGAGGEVAPKRDGIGAKNHGLRVAFWIGDTISVQSNGYRTQLTTRRDPTKARFLPGAWRQPMKDADAPATGTRISILYRREDLLARGIEGLDLRAADAATADRLVTDMIVQAPLRLIGITHPTELPRYTLELVSLDGPPVELIFSCRTVGEADGHPLLERTVERRDVGNATQLISKERAVRFALRALKGNLKASWFFNGARGPEAEISWEAGPDGKPRSAQGALRYPIAYPADAGAVTDYGLHLSAPFVSDQARHSPASGGETNPEIIERAEKVAARILARHLVPKFGPLALELIRSAGISTERTSGLIEAVGNLGGLPIVASSKSHRRRGLMGAPRSLRRRTGWKTSRGPMVVPHSPNPVTARYLTQLLPRGTVQLHPNTPSFVVDAFVSDSMAHICRTFTRGDVIDRLCGTSERFRWPSEARRLEELSNPARMLLYLGVLSNEPHLRKSRANDIRRLAVLPISGRGSDLWCTVSWANSEPPEVPGVRKHKIIHPKLRRHGLLQTGPLRLERFNIEDRLSNLDWSNVVDSARETYLVWLATNAKHLKQRTVRAIAEHPVFQASDGSFHPFRDLCLIQDAPLRNALAQHVKAPSPKVLAIMRAKRTCFKIRIVPWAAEVRHWYQAVFGQIAARKNALDEETLPFLDMIEDTIQRLLRIGDRALVDEVRGWGHQTVNRSGHLRPIHELHAPTEAVTACKLSDHDLIGDGPTNVWRHFGIRETPSPAAILRIIDDAADANTFFRRPSAYLIGGGDPEALATIACIPTRAGMKIPSDVALRGRTSYWGAWKTTVEVKIS